MWPTGPQLRKSYINVTTEKLLAGVNVLGAESNPTTIDLKDVFRFTVAEAHTSVVLTEDFLSLETSAYDRFSNFLAQWEQILQAARDTMGLHRQARLGLRFTNIIEREGIDTLDGWSGLIEQHLLNDARHAAERVSASAFVSQHTIRLATLSGAIAFRHGFPSLPGENLSAGYFLDIDNYNDQPMVIDVERHREHLTAWDHQSYRLLHGSVTQALWDSFKPEGA